MQIEKRGILYVVATPIGNLQDITLRAIDVLKNVDRIAAEDTRYAKRLLDHFSIHKPILSLHAFNEYKQLKSVLTLLESGQSIALISDAGTPLISDPGYHLIKLVASQGLTIIPLPGPCAAIAALCVSGLPTDQFSFEGFLPAKPAARHKRLMKLKLEKRTMIFYEAPHRLQLVLKEMIDIFGEKREAVVAREISKIHETIYRQSLLGLFQWFRDHPEQCRGECVILVKGNAEEDEEKQCLPSVLDILLQELPIKQAVTLTSKITQERKNHLYQLALSKRESRG